MTASWRQWRWRPRLDRNSGGGEASRGHQSKKENEAALFWRFPARGSHRRRNGAMRPSRRLGRRRRRGELDGKMAARLWASGGGQHGAEARAGSGRREGSRRPAGCTRRRLKLDAASG
jgi:hypothetical protein